MEYKDIYSYYVALISMANALLPEDKKEDRLTKKEIRFLAYCCVYMHNGNNVEKFSAMAKYIVNVAGFKNSREVSTYKTRLGTKKWIKAARDTFVISNLLMNPRDEKVFKIVYVGE